MSKVFVCKTIDVRPESSKTFVVEGKKIMVLNDHGEFRAFFNFCPHMGGDVRFDGRKMYCGWHGAQFDPCTGEAVTGPASEGTGLDAVKLMVEDGSLYVEFEIQKSPWADDF